MVISELKVNYLCRFDTIFYDLPDTKSRRVTGLGYGRRFNGMVNPASLVSPPPNTYTLDSAFGGKSPKSRAFSFGLSREHFKGLYIPENPQVEACVPGPG